MRGGGRSPSTRRPPYPSYTSPLVTLPSPVVPDFTSVPKTSQAIHHALDGIFESDRCAKLTVMQVLLHMGKLTGLCTYRLNIDSVLEQSSGYEREGKPGDCSIKPFPPMCGPGAICKGPYSMHIHVHNYERLRHSV